MYIYIYLLYGTIRRRKWCRGDKKKADAETEQWENFDVAICLSLTRPCPARQLHSFAFLIIVIVIFIFEAPPKNERDRRLSSLHVAFVYFQFATMFCHLFILICELTHKIGMSGVFSICILHAPRSHLDYSKARTYTWIMGCTSNMWVCGRPVCCI